MDYDALFNQGIYSNAIPGYSVFAGTTDDPSYGDLGGLFDTFNTAVTPPFLSVAEDAALVNLAADTLSGYAVNAIAIEVPIAQLTRTGAIEPATSPAATIGVWATTSRARVTVRRSTAAGPRAGPERGRLRTVGFETGAAPGFASRSGYFTTNSACFVCSAPPPRNVRRYV